MAYLENTPTIKPEVGKNVYLCGMKEEKDIAFDAMIDELMKEQLPPYTMEEIYAMIEEGERQIAAGECYTTEEVLKLCMEEPSQSITT